VKYRKLGNTELEVSVISMGCWGISDCVERARKNYYHIERVHESRVTLSKNQGLKFFDFNASHIYILRKFDRLAV